ncbi:acyl-CoA thioesterase [Boudabousia marimammalium]|uniref:acyl-CoA thioesterase n=1 Tax=Boudabousia marimammalium TaxID=156892 RepID=UPI001300EE46|nr:acyl-CoA thioesterase domain-containing protein [Boudabousia marimammalium]
MSILPTLSPIPVKAAENTPASNTLKCLSLTKGSESTLVGQSLPQLFAHVYGGQLISQALMAAAAAVDDERQDYPHSVHANFLRAGSTDEEIVYTPSALTNGRSFAARLVQAHQGHRRLLELTASFQRPQSGVTHGLATPLVKKPEAFESSLDFFASQKGPLAEFLAETSAFDLRHVDGRVYTHPAAERSGPHRVWLRPRCEVPSNPQIVHRALLAYVLDQLLMEPLLKRQGLCWTTPGLALASLDYSIWFHHNIDINDWYLFVGDSPVASGSRGLIQASIFDSSFRLVATIAQEAMIRLPQEGEDAGRWAFDGRGLKTANK